MLADSRDTAVSEADMAHPHVWLALEARFVLFISGNIQLFTREALNA